MAIMHTKQWTYLVLGLGKTGMSCAHYLQKKQFSFAMADSRDTVPAAEAFIAENSSVDIFYGNWRLDVLLQAECLVISPGIALSEPVIAQAIAQGVKVSSDIELFLNEVTQPVAAITGSNGKSTVVSLLGEMAKCSGLSVPVAGNIGLPVLDLLDAKGAEMQQAQRHVYDAYILELSSFQLERLPAMSFDCACVLNISEDHMDRYDSYADYIAAKQRVYLGAKTCVFNRQDEHTLVKHSDESQQLVSFGVDEASAENYGIRVVDKNVRQDGAGIQLTRGDDVLVDSTDVTLQGQHNLTNVLAALAISDAMGWKREAAMQALGSFSGLAHRCEFVANINNVIYINDSKGTNVGATLAAIEGLCALADKRVVLILGGEGKGADFSLLKQAIKRYVRALVCIGAATPELMKLFKTETQSEAVENMQDAVARATELAQAGDYVLLSPACASFDMFKNFEHRGEVFVDAVEVLSAQAESEGGAHV